MRLFAFLLAGVLLVPAQAWAQDATWLSSPGSNNWFSAANWTPSTVPTGAATFGSSSITSIDAKLFAQTNIGELHFLAGAPSYDFALAGQNFNGAGITGLSSVATITVGTPASGGSISFTGTATAGAATIITPFPAETFFSGSSSAGSAIIKNNGGNTNFNDTATAGGATVTNNSGAITTFYNNTTAGNSIITDTGGHTIFRDTSTADRASITNSSGNLQFYNQSTAANATIINGGTTSFFQTSTAGNASITNTTGIVDFSASSGPNNDHKITAGSLAGAGYFFLGVNELAVGSNNLSTAVSGVISGINGSLVKVGTGNLTLSGTNTYTGATTVNGGTLTVNGNLTSSTGVSVNADGTLAGAGTVGNTSVAGGTLAPGSGTSGSSLNINGALGLNAASTYAVNVNGATASFANVSGAATLGGATANAIFASGGTIVRQYTILNAVSIGGSFGALTYSNKPAAINGSLSYDATHAYLNLVLNYQALASNTFNTNQNNVGNALVNYFNTTGGILTVFATLNGNGLSQASGQPGASTSQAGFTATGQFVNAIFDGAFDDNGQGGALGFAADDDAANAYAANAYATKRKVPPEAKDAYAAVTPRDRATPASGSRWNVWASAYGGNSRVNGDASAGTSTTTSRIFGAVAGASYRATPNTQLGFALGGAGSSFGLDGSFGGGKADIFNAAVYAKHTIGAAYVAGALSYSWQDTTTDRTVTISGTDQLHASFKAQALAGRLEGGWRYATPMVSITPYTALQATTFYLPAYGETATSGSNTFALNYASKTVTATRGELGAKFDKAMLVQGGVFTLKVKTAWAHDWNTDRSAAATFQALPGASFTVNGAQPSANAALVSLGGEMGWFNGWSVAANFDGEFSRTTAGYAGKGSVKYAW